MLWSTFCRYLSGYASKTNRLRQKVRNERATSAPYLYLGDVESDRFHDSRNKDMNKRHRTAKTVLNVPQPPVTTVDERYKPCRA
jgi:hypothetical protein